MAAQLDWRQPRAALILCDVLQLGLCALVHRRQHLGAPLLDLTALARPLFLDLPRLDLPRSQLSEPAADGQYCARRSSEMAQPNPACPGSCHMTSQPPEGGRPHLDTACEHFALIVLPGFFFLPKLRSGGLLYLSGFLLLALRTHVEVIGLIL